MTSVRPRPRILDFRPVRKGSLRGFLSVQLPSGLIVREVGVHIAGSKSWCAPPARPWMRGTELITDAATGKLKWQPLIDFSTHGVRSSWSRQILRALNEAYPEVLAEAAANAEDEADSPTETRRRV